MATETEDWLEHETIANNGDITAVQFKNDYNESGTKNTESETEYKIGTGETFEDFLKSKGLEERPENFQDDAYLLGIYEKYKNLYPDPSTKPLEDADFRAKNRKKMQLLGEAFGLLAQNVSSHTGGLVHRRKNNMYDKIDAENAKAANDYRAKLLANQKLRNDAIARELEANNDKAKANAQWNRGLQQFYMNQEGIKRGEYKASNEENSKVGSKEVGQVASSGKGGVGGSGSSDKERYIQIRDNNGNYHGYGFNVGKKNVETVITPFINRMKDLTGKEIDAITTSDGTSLRQLLATITAMTDPEAKSQVFFDFMTQLSNNPEYSNYAIQVFDEMNNDKAFTGLMHKQPVGKYNKSKKYNTDPRGAFDEEEGEDVDFQ